MLYRFEKDNIVSINISPATTVLAGQACSASSLCEWAHVLCCSVLPAVMARCEVLGLYRRLLRLHQRLPGDFGPLGSRFVQQEFKGHKGASSEHARLFLREWTVSEIVRNTASVELENCKLAMDSLITL